MRNTIEEDRDVVFSCLRCNLKRLIHDNNVLTYQEG